MSQSAGAESRWRLGFAAIREAEGRNRDNLSRRRVEQHTPQGAFCSPACFIVSCRGQVAPFGAIKIWFSIMCGESGDREFPYPRRTRAALSPYVPSLARRSKGRASWRPR